MSEDDVPGERAKDPLWKNYATLSSTVAKMGEKLGEVEGKANKAIKDSSTALQKVDSLAHAQVSAQKDFTLALQAQTTALRTLNDSFGSVKFLGIILLVLMALVSLSSFATLVLTSQR